jgi:hypothetical protein
MNLHVPRNFPLFYARPRIPLLLDDNSVEALGVLDVDGLDVAVQLLLGALLVVTPAGDADAESEGAALDTLLPDLLVQLGVDPDVGGALFASKSSQFMSSKISQPLTVAASLQRRMDRTEIFCALAFKAVGVPTIDWVAKALISLMALGALFLKVTPCRRLCRWMVYSRATTSAMAERPCLPAGFWVLDDISAAVS